MAIVVRATSDGFEVAEDDRALSTHATLREALDAARNATPKKTKRAFLRDPDTNRENGIWRWLPATEEESAAIDGVRIDATAIRELADSLNARSTPVAINGGPTPRGMIPSVAHGGGDALANGWAHDAVVALGDDGVHELYLWSEFVPEVAREMDAGRIALGSVQFGFARIEDELPRGCVLVSHALTNDPGVTTLAPANSVRVGDRDVRTACRTRSLAGRMRGASRARVEGSMSEKSESTESETPAEGEAKRAMIDAAELAAALGEYGVTAEMSLEEIAAAIAAAIKAKGEVAASADAERARAALSLETMRAQHKALAEEVATMRPIVEAHRARERDDKVHAALAAKRITDAARTARWLAHAEKHGVESALAGIEDVATPPSGERIFKPSTSRGAAPETTNVDAVRAAERKKAVAAEEIEVKREQPDLPSHRVLTEARARVRARSPELFGVATSNETAAD